MYMNIDFSQDATFSLYVVFLLALGVALIVMATPALPHVNTGLRAANGIFGLLLFGYGFYLGFLFNGGTYWIALKVFILPVLLIASTIKAAFDGAKEHKAKANQAAVAAPVAPPQGYGAPPQGYGAPPQGYGAPLMAPAPQPAPVTPVGPVGPPAFIAPPPPAAPPVSPIEEVR